MAKVAFIGNTSACRKYTLAEFIPTVEEIMKVDMIGLDTETTVTDSILTRELKVISVSWRNEEGETDMAVFEFDYLDQMYKDFLFRTLESKVCVIHNVTFDAAILRKYGCNLEKVKCTYLGELILTTGLSSEAGYHGLKAVYDRRFGLDISKSSQLTFGEGPYTDQQIQYAALDVYKILDVYDQQLAEMKSDDKFMDLKFHKGLVKTWWWENEFAKVIVDMEMEGVLIHKDKWHAIADSVQPIFDKELASLNEIAIRDFNNVLLENDFISSEDRIIKIWGSSTKKLALLSRDFEGLTSTSGLNLKKWLKENDPNFPREITSVAGKQWKEHEYRRTLTDKYAIIKILIGRNKDTSEKLDLALNKYAINNHRDWLIEQEWLIPKGELTLNWASPSQRLILFQSIVPTLSKTGKDFIKEIEDKHIIFSHYLKWGEVAYQLKSFGKDFYDKNVDLDGRFRTRFNQILATGRLSSVSPNLLAIPSSKVYRSCFIPKEGKILVGADYSTQEISIMATLSKSKLWLDVIAAGQDIHSINAELVYGNKWLDATEQGCAYYAKTEQGKLAYQKCDCKKHKEYRTAVKVVVFSSTYGASFIKLSFLLSISEEEAKQLLSDFHTRLPKLKTMMDKFANYSITHGRIIEPVFGRSRFFDKWKLVVAQEHGSIGRQANNYPVQSSGGAMLKIAMVLFRRYLIHNNLVSKIKIILLIHDEALLECNPNIADLAKEKLEYFMQLGAKLSGFNIKAKANAGNNWSLIH